VGWVPAFAALRFLKYEELLIILLKGQPELAGIFFDYAAPEKKNLEEFMHRNFKFNATVEQFAYLTGRSCRNPPSFWQESPRRGKPVHFNFAESLS
jgi:hypothetical protein